LHQAAQEEEQLRLMRAEQEAREQERQRAIQVRSCGNMGFVDLMTLI
jgi:hypothetical protein